MKNVKFLLIALSFFALFAIGCLTFEKKEYTFKFTGDNSGVLTIKYINLISIKDDTVDISAKDFDELISTYITGDQIEKDYPNAANIDKRLFEENGVLCAELKIEFLDLADVRLFQLSKKEPFMYSLCGFIDSENYESSNGEYGGENMPVVFWSHKLKELKLTTLGTPPDESSVSLLEEYKKWKE
ncbi:MAG: hypothetical protein KAV44_11290 [Bacteroidales bacterium]|nr:hypothetical protein [Bacteroidales bacterium]